MSAHSQILTTFQPAVFRNLLVRRSRILLPWIFFSQRLVFVFGFRFLPQQCPCQKHPSTKTANLALGQIKSGLPAICAWRRHPLIPFCLSNFIANTSVVLLPLLRTRDINCDRVNPPKVVLCVCAPAGHLDMLSIYTSSSFSLAVVHRSSVLGRSLCGTFP